MVNLDSVHMTLFEGVFFFLTEDYFCHTVEKAGTVLVLKINAYTPDWTSQDNKKSMGRNYKAQGRARLCPLIIPTHHYIYCYAKVLNILFLPKVRGNFLPGTDLRES